MKKIVAFIFLGIFVNCSSAFLINAWAAIPQDKADRISKQARLIIIQGSNRASVSEAIKAVGSPDFVLNHTLNVIWLSENMPYAYNVTSCDMVGNCNTSNIYYHSTLPEHQVATCRELNKSNQVYIMINSIIDNTLSGPCINITAENVTLNCNGSFIKSNKPRTGVYSNQFNTTIKNCTIDMGGYSEGMYGKGIELMGANYSYIFNNTLTLILILLL